VALNKGFVQALEEVRCWDGAPLPAQLHAELQRQWERYELAGSTWQRCTRSNVDSSARRLPTM